MAPSWQRQSGPGVASALAARSFRDIAALSQNDLPSVTAQLSALTPTLALDEELAGRTVNVRIGALNRATKSPH